MRESGKGKSEETELEDADALWDHIDARGRKGTEMQRYKGLGEMNPSQLWETTLDPNTRVMLQVRLDDLVRGERRAADNEQIGYVPGLPVFVDHGVFGITAHAGAALMVAARINLAHFSVSSTISLPKPAT